MPPKLAESQLEPLDNRPGVYCFHGVDDELLYVGKSVRIRERVRSHFRANNDSRKSERIFQETASITTYPTAGDLGASLLELQHIKDRQPLLNKQSRKKKQLVVLTKASQQGYLFPDIERVKTVDSESKDEILGVFKSKKQAKNTIENLAREYDLCRQRLQIATRLKQGACFHYQLGQCRGACIGEDKPQAYNQRFRRAFADYQVQSWPFSGPVLIEETNDGRTDEFVVNNWVIASATVCTSNQRRDFFRSVPNPATFNYDTYKQLARVLLRPDSDQQITVSDINEQ